MTLQDSVGEVKWGIFLKRLLFRLLAKFGGNILATFKVIVKKLAYFFPVTVYKQ